MRGRKDLAKVYHPVAWQRLPGQGGGPLGGTGRNTVGPPGESKGPEVRRGKIYSFDAATYTAEVFVDGSPTAVTLPVAKNLAAILLAAATKVAVLCFDPSDPEDAVVLGPYDGVPSAWITGGLIVADAINDTHIDWGTGTNQVSAVDVPIADTGGYFTTDNVEAALQELGAGGGGGGGGGIITVKNTSGGTVAAGDLGYIDENGEFKTTTTEYLNAAWCVVTVGGANNADIEVARQGRVTVVLNGNCSAGDYLYTSTTAKQARAESYVRPELFAVALTANSAGAGGTCSALLLCNTQYVPLVSGYDLMNTGASVAQTDWRGTINGAPVSTSVVYATTSGNENVIDPYAGTELAKMRLYNETRTTYALISDVDTGTNTITVTDSADISGWQNGDVITVRSQTCVVGAAPYYADYEIVSEIPELARALEVQRSWRDTGAAWQRLRLHTWETFSSAKQKDFYNTVASSCMVQKVITIPLFRRRFCARWEASGTNTASASMRIVGAYVAVP
jgi:hypothetical protein